MWYLDLIISADSFLTFNISQPQETYIKPFSWFTADIHICCVRVPFYPKVIVLFVCHVLLDYLSRVGVQAYFPFRPNHIVHIVMNGCAHTYVHTWKTTALNFILCFDGFGFVWFRFNRFACILRLYLTLLIRIYFTGMAVEGLRCCATRGCRGCNLMYIHDWCLMS